MTEEILITNEILFSLASLFMVIALTILIMEPKERANTTTFKISLTICVCYISIVSIALLLGKMVIMN